MIYLDNAATTKMNSSCLDILKKYSEDDYFNASAMYKQGNNLHKEIENAKNTLLSLLGTNDGKIYFTSGATEANNMAIFGSATFKQKKYLFSIGEHPSVYNTAMALKNSGFDVDFIPLSNSGEVDYTALKSMLSKDVCFVSTMLVNNETGVINDIKKIREIIDSVNPSIRLHVDAVQGFCKVPFNIKSLKVDLCTLSGHKIYGPKGVGALYVSKNAHLKGITYGGEQEEGVRPGTYNTPGIMAMTLAASDMKKDMMAQYNYVKALKSRFIDNLTPIKDKIIINGNGSPYILSISINGLRGETVLHMLEQDGIIIGTGSACSSSKVENRVLTAMGRTKDEVLGSIRISFSKNNTQEEIDFAASKLIEAVNKLLAM